MRALSIQGPNVYDIFHNGKDVENRRWQTHFRGHLLIQASGRNKDYPHGVIYGIVELYDCVQDSDSTWANPGDWHWLLRNPIRIKPVPYRGQLSIYHVKYATLDQIYAEASKRVKKIIDANKEFDYTRWQREHFDGISVEELTAAAVAYARANPPKFKNPHVRILRK